MDATPENANELVNGAVNLSANDTTSGTASDINDTDNPEVKFGYSAKLAASINEVDFKKRITYLFGTVNRIPNPFVY